MLKVLFQISGERAIAQEMILRPSFKKFMSHLTPEKNKLQFVSSKYLIYHKFKIREYFKTRSVNVSTNDKGEKLKLFLKS